MFHFHTPEILENLWFYAVFRRYKNGTLDRNGLKSFWEFLKFFRAVPSGNYMFKVDNRNTRTYFTPCYSVSIVNFENVIAGWGCF